MTTTVQEMQSTAAEPPFTVRELRDPSPREIERVAVMFDEYRVHYGLFADATGTAEWLRGRIVDGGLVVHVAADGGEMIGFATSIEIPASQRLGHFWQIRDLFVIPTHRRRGVAQALLDHVRTAAIATGALRITLTTEVDNNDALSLYSRLGYRVVEGFCSLELSLES